jgi:hypothetical protein
MNYSELPEHSTFVLTVEFNDGTRKAFPNVEVDSWEFEKGFLVFHTNERMPEKMFYIPLSEFRFFTTEWKAN